LAQCKPYFLGTNGIFFFFFSLQNPGMRCSGAREKLCIVVAGGASTSSGSHLILYCRYKERKQRYGKRDNGEEVAAFL
jgi:hypothetical protein